MSEKDALRERIIAATETHAQAESELGYNRWHCKGCGEVIHSGRRSRAARALAEHHADAILAVLLDQPQTAGDPR